MTAAMEPLPSSFRDPSGYVFNHGGDCLRAVQPEYEPHLDRLLGTGLYRALVDQQLLIPHDDITPLFPERRASCRVLKPRQVEFISYPFEWSFSQLKDAALTTLRIQQEALARGMSLKDASAYNLQFVDGAPVHIDTLSFEILPPGKPWVAYRQFCSHFLAPLVLMSYGDVRLHQLQRIYLDGLPLDLAAALAPGRSRWNLGVLVHLHLHARSQRLWQGRRLPTAARHRAVSLNGLRGLTAGLQRVIEGLNRRPDRRQWGNYYDETILGGGYLERKTRILESWLGELRPPWVWDLGANTGHFSRVASAAGCRVVSFDVDPECVELNYLENRARRERRVLPLVLDLMNPSPSCGWSLAERSSFLQRRSPDLVMGLALVHHLAVGNNLPLPWIARFFQPFAPALILEFVPKDDLNAQRLLQSREDIFPTYDQAHFEAAFEPWYRIERTETIPGCARRLYQMSRR
jgi:hypothetical protein